MRAIHALVVAIALVAVVPAAALDPPDHEVWRSSMDALAQARDEKDADKIKEQLPVLFEQALRLAANDSRTGQTSDALDRSLEIYSNLRGSAAAHALRTELYEMTKVDGALSSPFSMMLLLGMTSHAEQVGNFDEARQLMRDFRARAASELGSNHAAVRGARLAETDIAAAVGDVEYAIAELESLLAETERAFGPHSREATGVLRSLVRAHHFGEDVDGAIEILDRAAAAAEGDDADVDLLTSFADAYVGLNQNSRAAQLLERAEELYLERFGSRSGYEGWLFQLYRNLTLAHLRSGNSEAALESMYKGVAVAASIEARRPDLALEAAYLSLDVLVHAGARDRTDAMIAAVEARAAEIGRADTKRHREAMASINLGAGHYERTAELAEALMKQYERGSEGYARAAQFFVRAKARQNPPIALLELAEEVAAINRRVYEPGYRQLAASPLAESYAAAGRFDEAVSIMRAGIERQTALYGEESVRPQTWEAFARYLEGAGDKEAETIFARVRDVQQRLDAALRTYERMAEPVTHRSEFGFSIELEDPSWRPIQGTVVSAFTAIYANQTGAISVMPALLSDGLDAATAEQLLVHLLQLSSVTREPWSKGEQSGYEYRFERSVGARLVYRFIARLIIEPRAIYLAVASGNKDLPDAIERAERALDGIRFDHEPVRSDELTGESRAVHGQLLNHLGVWHYERGRLDQALSAYRRARVFHESEELYQNMALAQLELGRWQDVIDTVNGYPGDPAAAPGLLAWRAFARTQLASFESEQDAAISAAIEDYAAAFAADYVDDDSAYEYVSLLVDADRASEASQFLTDYGARSPSPNVVALEALVALSLEDEAKLTEKLALLEDPARSSADAVLIGALVHFQRGGLQALASFAERAHAAGLGSVELYWMIGSYQLEAEAFESARETFERALTLAPGDEELEAMRDYAQAQIPERDL